MDDAGPDDFDPPCEVCGVNTDDCKCPVCPKCGVVGDESCYHQHGLQDLIQRAPDLLVALKAIADYPPADGRRTEDGYPLEVVYDEFAYRRMVDSYRKVARDVLAKLEGK